VGLRASAELRPVKVREYDAELHCDVLRVVGYRAHCGCKWRSTTLPTILAARAALVNHRVKCSAPRELRGGKTPWKGA